MKTVKFTKAIAVSFHTFITIIAYKISMASRIKHPMQYSGLQYILQLIHAGFNWRIGRILRQEIVQKARQHQSLTTCRQAKMALKFSSSSRIPSCAVRVSKMSSNDDRCRYTSDLMTDCQLGAVTDQRSVDQFSLLDRSSSADTAARTPTKYGVDEPVSEGLVCPAVNDRVPAAAGHGQPMADRPNGFDVLVIPDGWVEITEQSDAMQRQPTEGVYDNNNHHCLYRLQRHQIHTYGRSES
jgi:hypothetical protein